MIRTNSRSLTNGKERMKIQDLIVPNQATGQIPYIPISKRPRSKYSWRKTGRTLFAYSKTSIVLNPNKQGYELLFFILLSLYVISRFIIVRYCRTVSLCITSTSHPFQQSPTSTILLLNTFAT